MIAEYEGLEAAGMSAYVDIPPECNIVGAKWVFQWKTDSNGTTTNGKARLVPKGFSQVEGVDYFETFTPTPSPASMRLVVAMGCKIDWNLSHFDVEQAFIQSDLDSKIYIQLLPGCGSISGIVGRLTKFLYELKQASRQWYHRLLSELKDVGFEQCLTGPVVYDSLSMMSHL